MKRSPLIMAAVGIAVVLAFALAACEDEPTQAEANEQFCDAAGNYIAALRDLHDLDKDSTVGELQDTRDQVAALYDDMVDAAADVASVRLDEVDEARNDLVDAVDAISDEATLGEALDEVDDEIENVVSELSQALNDVDCGNESSGGSQSDE